MYTIIEYYNKSDHLIKCIEDIEEERILVIDYNESIYYSFSNADDFTTFLKNEVNEIKYISNDYKEVLEAL